MRVLRSGVAWPISRLQTNIHTLLPLWPLHIMHSWHAKMHTLLASSCLGYFSSHEIAVLLEVLAGN